MSVLLEAYEVNQYRDFEVISKDGEEFTVCARDEDEAWEEAAERGMKPAYINELEPPA